jgi:hypothetical protein
MKKENLVKRISMLFKKSEDEEIREENNNKIK